MSMQEIEVLRQSVETLRKQKKEQEDILVELDQGIKVGNRFAIESEIKTIQDKINTVVNKISEIEYELKLQEQTAEIEAQHEEQAKEVAKNNAYVLDTLEVEGITMSQLSASATAYEILREAVQQVLNTQTQKILDQLKAVKEDAAKTIAELQKQKDLSDEALQLKTEQYNLLRNDYTSIVDENKDLATKRDAAAAELESSKAEIDRLKGELDDLRIEKAVGARDAIKVTNLNGAGALADKIAAYKQSLPAIYDVTQLDAKGSRYSAKLAETGETIEFGWIEKNKYREVTAEQAETFRTEYNAKQESAAAEEAEQVGTDSSGPVALEEQPVTAGQFQTGLDHNFYGQQESETAAAGLAEEDTSVAMAGKEFVTKQEFSDEINKLREEVRAIQARIAV